jgi:hypothetical protein
MTDQPDRPPRPPSREMLLAGWPIYYILVGHTPSGGALGQSATATATPIASGAPTSPTACHVSTVFTGLDHQWRDGDPLLFETMIFGGPLDQEQDRYSTWEQAERGHADAVTRARKAIAQVVAIAREAGATNDYW